ncbi:hypothetical protein NDU88_000700 [Pleurodeles waltl]|uniref:Uncharacterized protein n=1 Tax=Pleurodeles waltl TaxID=8319 RepID=A0AAV7SAE2_PLEWA|nr:hypothetical protein NDU88_000700 [Pleurodeles waltl]
MAAAPDTALRGPVKGWPPWASWCSDGRRTFFPLLLWEVVPVAVSGTLVWRRPCGIGGHLATASALIRGHAAISSRSQLLPRTRVTDSVGKMDHFSSK